MENMEEIYHFLEDFSKRKPKVIPQELNNYLAYVATTGDPVYQWSLVKTLFKEKLMNVITDFYESTPSVEIPPYPNVDPFNYEIMKNSLMERLDSFTSAPFTVQRICELLTDPRKQYNRVDKFMRAVEKNILVVSTREPGPQRHIELENGEPAEPIVNGSENSDYNVDVEMEDMSWKGNSAQSQAATSEPQPSSSETHISVDDVEARLNAKQDIPLHSQEKTTEYESLTPPELNVTDEQEMKSNEEPDIVTTSSQPPKDTTEIEIKNDKMEEIIAPAATEEPKADVEMKPMETDKDPLIIPEIKVDDAEMTEQRLSEESSKQSESEEKIEAKLESPTETTEHENEKPEEPTPVQQVIEENIEKSLQPSAATVTTNVESSTVSIVKDDKEDSENKVVNEVITSSEESSSSSDNTDGNSNSPKLDLQSDSMESSSDLNQVDSSLDADIKPEPPQEPKPIGDTVADSEPSQIQSENYSISDVKSELVQPAQPIEEITKEIELPKEEIKEETILELNNEEDKNKSVTAAEPLPEVASQNESN